MTIDWFDGTQNDFLSNFHPSPISWTDHFGHRWDAPTVEHAFQAAKAHHPEDVGIIIRAHEPGVAKRLGQRIQLREDWEDVKRDVMEELLLLKFSKGSPLLQRLLDTGDQFLLEGNNWHDQVWGSCTCRRHKDTPGQNWLGRTLMKVREARR